MIWALCSFSILLLFQHGVSSSRIGTAHAFDVAEAAPIEAAGAADCDSLSCAYLLIDEGRCVDAEQASREILSDFAARFGPDSPEVADALGLLVEALRKGGRWHERGVVQSAARAVRIKDRYFGSDSPEFAASIFVLGKLRLELGQYEESELLFRSALQIRERAYGPVDPRVADVLYCLAESLRLQFAWEASKRLHERALTIYEGWYGREHRDVGKALDGLANTLADMGDPDRQAIEMYRQSAAVRERTLGPSHPELAVSLHNLAYQLYWDGEYREAKPIAERAVRIQEGTLPPEHPLIARSFMYLALINTELGHITEAQRQYERMVVINRISLTPGHPRIAEANVRYATLLKQIGDYTTARQLLERAAEVCGPIGKSTDVRIVDVLQELADLATDMGDYSEADYLFARGVEILQQERGPLHDHDIYEKQADFFFMTGRRDEALQLYEETAAHWERTEGDESPEYGRLLFKLARVHHADGEAAAAQPLYLEALDIRSRVSGPHHPEVAQISIGLAAAKADTGDYQGGIQTYHRALDVLEQVYPECHPLRAQCLRDVAFLQLFEGDLDAAVQTALAAEAIGRRHLMMVARSFAEREALRYASVRASGLDLALSLAGAFANEAWTEMAWDALIRSRALVVDEIAARHRAAVTTDDAAISLLLSDLAEARDRLAYLIVAGPSDRNPDRWRTILDDARRHREALERELSKRSLAFRHEQAMSDVGLREVTEALPEGSVLVGFARHQDFSAHDVIRGRADEVTWPFVYTALVLRGDEDPVAIPIGSAAEIDDLVGEIRRHLAVSATGSAARGPHAERTYRRTGMRVCRRVWDPIVPFLGDALKVLVVPDGSLNFLNLGALPIGEASYLAETGPRFHYISAERDVLGRTGSAHGSGLLAVGEPAFDEPRLFAGLRTGFDRDWLDRTVKVASLESYRGVQSSCDEFRKMRFAPLPSTGGEIDQVAALWSASSFEHAGTSTPGAGTTGAEVLRGAAANETDFKAMAPGRQIIHVATHGFFLDHRCQSTLQQPGDRSVLGPRPSGGGNPLQLSGLALAGANHRYAAGFDEDDGILTAEEIAVLDLGSVEWAVLSACDTGIGEVRAGEGVFGLRRAFQVAGARTLIMSLWQVEDEASRDWMRRLYENRFIKKLSTADAVHEASLALLAQRREAGLSTHPFYWAGFIASGDWR